MSIRCSSLLVVGWMGLLLLGSLAGPTTRAQDRGAPRFGPAAPSDTGQVEASATGRLWSVAEPPFDRFERRYEMAADSAWATHLRRSLLRLPNCTAALVSPNGLALTTAQCVRTHLDGGGDAGSIVAEENADERPLSGLHADRLVGVKEVTATVQAARQDTAVQRAVASVRQRLQTEALKGRRVEIASERDGGYTAYTYRRYEDVRVAFLPTRSVSDFGGLDAAMTYPRHALDAALLRVYTSEGTPLTADRFFEPPTRSVRPGDVLFAAGHAPETRRAESAEQLAVRRELTLPNRRDLLQTWTSALQSVRDTADATPQQRDMRREAQRARKRTQARLDALQDDHVMTRLRRRDDQFRQALREDPSLNDRFGGLLDSLAAIQDAKRSLASAYRAFGRYGGASYRSSTFRHIVQARRAETTSSASAAGEMGTATSMVREDSIGARFSAPVETAQLSFRLQALRQHLYPDTAAVRRVFQGQSPAERAAEIVNSSVLASSRDASSDASAPVVPDDDPVAAVVEVVRPRARSFYEEWNALTGSERRLTRRLARARQAVRGAPVQPGGANVPRLTDGRVLGYPYNGTTAPPFTTFFGLYDQHQSFGGTEPWTLPERWRRSAAEMDRSVPLNLAASTDAAVATRGGPLLNQYLQIVGVTMGTNIQGVAGTYLFLPERMRTVGVDLRGLRHAMTEVYGAEALVDELFGGTSSTSE